jgi:hypothetical protein
LQIGPKSRSNPIEPIQRDVKGLRRSLATEEGVFIMAALASNIIILFLIEDLEAKFSSEYFSQCPQ